MITETGKYAFEILGYLATFHMEDPVYQDEMYADLPTVPQSYGKKILTTLSRAKIVLSKKGRGMGCGVRINPAMLSVSLKSVLSHFDPPWMDSDDFTSGFKAYYIETQERIETELAGMTVLDLVRDQKETV